MSSTKIVSILGRVKSTLFDQLGVRWEDEELLDWFNAGQAFIVNMRPDAYAHKAEHSCTDGVEQVLPSDALRLIRVMGNVGGSSILSTTVDHLDQNIPDWQSNSDPVDDVEFYAYLEEDPRRFYLYPSPVAGHKVRVIYSRVPEPMDIAAFDYHSDSQVIALPDAYADPLVNYILYRCFSKDSDFSDMSKARGFYQLLGDAIKIKTESDSGVSPNG
jgi:hypothetical protein